MLVLFWRQFVAQILSKISYGKKGWAASPITAIRAPALIHVGRLLQVKGFVP